MAPFYEDVLDLFFESAIEFFFPLAHAQIDWARGYEFLDKELQKITADAALGRRVVDKLVKVWLKTGQELWVLLHVTGLCLPLPHLRPLSRARSHVRDFGG